MTFTAFRKVFLRWLNAVFTSKKNIFSVLTGRDSFFGVKPDHGTFYFRRWIESLFVYLK